MNYLVGDIGNTSIKICKIDKKFRIKNTYLFKSKSSNLKKELTAKIKSMSKKILIKTFYFQVLYLKFLKKLSLF